VKLYLKSPLMSMFFKIFLVTISKYLNLKANI